MTPCYYCELDRETDCKNCIHGDFCPDEVESLRERVKQLTEDLQMVAKYCDNLEPGDIKKFVTGALATKGGA